MEYLILTETEFFGLINGSDETAGLNAAYSRFVKESVELQYLIFEKSNKDENEKNS